MATNDDTANPANHPNFLADFFAGYTSFAYNANRPPTSEFRRMCKTFRKRKIAFDRDSARRAFKDALTFQFNAMYGTDVDDVHCWQGLCRALQIEPVPTGLEECRQLVRSLHVNLVDLVHQPSGARIFPTLPELVKYTIRTEKFFPKENAYAGGVLRFLLREILHPYRGKRSNV